MGLTFAQAKSLGLERFHPAASGARSAERELLDRLALKTPPASATSAVVKDGLNKLERAFRDNVLEPAYVAHRIARYWREPVKLRLAGRTYFAPDFLVELPSGEHGLAPRLIFVETKGFMRDDAAVKLKVAAADYPCFGWLLVTRARASRRLSRPSRWEARLVTARGGIGVDPVIVPWMEG